MAREERLRSKTLYKAVVVLLKFIPALLALSSALNTFFCLFGIESYWLSYFGGVSFLTLAFLYLASYVFQFCVYHRMFLHYVLVTNIIGLLDLEIGIPVSDLVMFNVQMFLLFLLSVLVLYYYRHEKLKAVSSKDDRRHRCGQLQYR